MVSPSTGAPRSPRGARSNRAGWIAGGLLCAALVVPVHASAQSRLRDLLLSEHHLRLETSQAIESTDPLVNWQGDSGRVSIFEFDGDYSRFIEGSLNLGARAAVAQEFFADHADAYDVLIVFSAFDFDRDGASAFQIGVRNDVEGVGLDVFDQSAVLGSAGVLRSYIDMGPLVEFESDPLDPDFESTLAILVHEIFHQWGAYSAVDQGGTTSEDLLQSDGSHWSFLLDSGASVLYGNDWEDNGDGTFTAVDALRVVSPLDLYLGGFYAAEEVPTFSLLDATGVDPDRLPEPNATIVGTASTISVSDIIAAEGPRVPPAEEAPHALRAAFLFLTEPGESASEAELAALESIRAGLLSRFVALTGGRGRLEIFPEPIDSEGGGPSGTGGGDIRPTSASVLDALAWLRVAQTVDGFWEDRPSTQVRDSAIALSILGEIDPLFTPGAAALGMEWLAQSSPAATDLLARKARLIPNVAGDAARAELVSRRNLDGGWGLDAGIGSDPFDTALVLDALEGFGYDSEVAAGQAYLLGRQSVDGGWSMTAAGPSHIASTVAAISALPSPSAALTGAVDFLVTKQNADGGFGDSPSTAHSTALALSALLDLEMIDILGPGLPAAKAYLMSRQDVPGSWEGSVYATALVARTLQRLALPNWALDASPSPNPVNPTDGETVELAIAVHNDGNGMAPPSVVRLFDGDPDAGGTVIADAPIGALGPGQSTTPLVFWDTYDLPGPHQLVAIVDPDGSTAEVSESDNRATLALVVAEAPVSADLSIAADAMTITPPAPNELPTALSISTTVRNLGQTEATNVRFALWSGEPEVGVFIDESSATVGERSSIVVNFSAELTQPGTTGYSFVADSLDEVEEVDEDNNVGSAQVTTVESVDLEILDSDVSIATSPVYSGQDAIFSVRIRNRGTVDSPTAGLSYLVTDGTEVRTLPAPTVIVEAGETVVRTALWRVDLTGDLTFSAKVDPAGAIPELDESNNLGAVTFEALVPDQPNLTIGFGDLLADLDPAREGSPLTLTARVRNTGPTDLIDVEVAFFDGDPEAGGVLIEESVVLPLVAAGGEVVAERNWAEVPDAADRVIVVQLDPSDTIVEVDETDNSTFIELEVISLPDLALAPGLIDVDPPLPGPGQTAIVTATVQNLGQQGVDSLVVRAFEGGASSGVQIDLDQVIAIPGLGTAEAVFSWTLSGDPGARMLTIVADPDAAIPESVESNNEASLLVGVQEGGFVVSEPIFSPNADGALDTTTLLFELDTPQTVHIEIIDAARDKVVLRHSGPEMLDVSSGEFVWNGRGDDGFIVRDADFTLRVLDEGDEILGQVTTTVDTNLLSLIPARDTEQEDLSNLTCQPNPENYAVPANDDWGYFRVKTRPTAEYPKGLYRSRLDGSQTERVISEPWLTDSQSVDHFVISADGSTVAFRVLDTGDPFDPADDVSTLWVSNGDGTGLFELVTDSPELPFNHVWEILGFSGSHRTLLVDHGSHGLVEFRLDGPPTPFVRAPSGLEYLGFSPDHTYLTVEDSAGNTVRALHIDAGTFVDLFSSSSVVTTWSPDSSRIAVVESRFVHVVTPDGLLLQTISVPELIDGSRPFVAADTKGAAWAFKSNELATIAEYEDTPDSCLGQRVLFTLDLGTGAATEWARSERGLPCHLRESEDPAGDQSEAEEEEADIGLGTSIYWDPADRALITSKLKVRILDEDVPWLQLTPLGLGLGVVVSSSGRYWLYESNVEVADAEHPCYSNPGLIDTFSFRTLENLSLELGAFRPPHSDGIELSGTATDKHFKLHALAWSDAADPTVWYPIGVPSTQPVIDELLGTWIPPYPGAFTIRMTAEDAAGNTDERTKRVVASTSPDLTSVDVQPRLISPNGDAVLDEAAISYTVEQPVHVVIRILDNLGALVRTYERSYPSGGVSDAILWDGRNEAGLVVPDGDYEILVNQYRFPIESDITPPGVSSYASILQPPTSGLGLPGSLFLAFQATDANAAPFPVERGMGSPPSFWETVPAACAPEPAGYKCSTSLAPEGFVGHSFRAIARDLAGNETSMVTEAPQGLVTTHFGAHSVDPVTGQLSDLDPVGEVPFEVLEGDVRFAITDAVVEQLVDVVAEFRQCPCPLPGEPETPWSDSLLGLVFEAGGTLPVPFYPDTYFEIVWDGQGLQSGVEYQVRLKALDSNLEEFFSEPIKLLVHPIEKLIFSSIAPVYHESVPEFVRDALTNAGYDPEQVAVAIGSETYEAELSDFGLTLQSEDDEAYWIPRELEFLLSAPDSGGSGFESVVYFVMEDWLGCAVYEGTLTAEGPDGSLASVPHTSQLPCLEIQVDYPPVRVNGCGESPVTGRTILVTPRSLDLSELLLLKIEDNEGNEVLRVDGPESNTAYEWTIETAELSEGWHAYQAVLQNVNGVVVLKPGLSIVADRTPPIATITFPSSAERVCGQSQPAGNVMTFEGILADEQGLDFRIEYGRGADPAEWHLAEVGPAALPPTAPPFEALGQLEFLDDGTVERGALFLNHDGPLSSTGSIVGESGILTGRLRAVDDGWHLVCEEVTFEFDGLVVGTQVTATPRSFSPNADAVLDLSFISLTNTTEPVTADVDVYPGVIGESGPVIQGPLARALAGGVVVDGTQILEWDGNDDLGDRVADGSYLALVSWTDDCGNALVQAVELEVDTVAPAVNILSPTSGTPLPIMVNVFADVVDSNLQGWVVEYGLGGLPEEWVPIASGQIVASPVAEWNTFGLEGEHSLRLRAFDEAGNIGTDTVVLDFTERLAIISYLEALPDPFSPNGDGRREVAAIRFGLEEPAAVDLELIGGEGHLLVDHEDRLNGAYVETWDGSAADGSPMADAVYLVRLTAALSADPLVVQTEEVHLALDRVAPAVTITTPEAGGYVASSGFVFGSITDPLLEAYSISIDGVEVDAGTTERVDYAFASLQGYSEAEHELSILAEDAAENQTAVVQVFTLDDTPPQVDLFDPLPGAHLSSVDGPHEVEGSVLEVNLAYWSLEVGAGADPSFWVPLATSTEQADGTLFSWDVSGVADGLHTLRLVAVDLAANESTAALPLIIDNTPPTVEITAPPPSSWVTEPQDVSGTASDDNLELYELALAPQGTSAFTVFATGAAPVVNGVLGSWGVLPPDGDYDLRLEAGDRAGNSVSVLVTVAVDTLPPAVPTGLAATLPLPQDAALVWDANSEADLAGYHVYRDGVRITPTLEPVPSYFDLDLPEASYVYRVSAEDLAGNESEPSASAEVTVDLTPPTAYVLQPREGERVSGLVVIDGTAYSATDFAEFRVFALDGGGGSSLLRTSTSPVQADFLAAWNTDGLPEEAGYVLRLEADDVNGNTGIDEIVVTVDNLAPVAPTGLMATPTDDDIAVNWSPNSEPDLLGYLLFRNDELVNGDGSVLDYRPYALPETEYDDLDLPDGTFEYVVYAIDLAGNLSPPSAPDSATLDNRAPRAVIYQPEDGAEFEESLFIRAESEDSDVASVQFQVRAVGESDWLDLGGLITARPFDVLLDPEAQLPPMPYGSYEVRAVATDEGGNTDPAPVPLTVEYGDLTAPGVVTGLAGLVTVEDVALTWDPSSEDDLEGYNLYRAVDGGNEELITPALLSNPAYDDPGLADARYSYRVTAVDSSANESDPSGTVDALVYRPAIERPWTPTQDSAIDVVGIATADATVEGEVINGVPLPLPLANSDAAGNFELLGIPLNAGSNQLVVRATDGAGNLSKDASVAVVQGPPPTAPTSLTAEVAGFEVNLSWDANPEPDIEGYRVLRDGAPLALETTIENLTATASSTWQPPSNAVDGDPGTSWALGPNSGEQWLEVAFPDRRQLIEVQVDWNLFDTTYSIQVWTGSDWLEAFAGTSDEATVFRLSDPYRTDRLRILVDAAFTYSVTISEVVPIEQPTTLSTSYLDTAPDGVFDYMVTAVNSLGFESSPSAPATVEVGDVVPPDTVTLTATLVNTWDAELSWTESTAPDLASYAIYRDGILIASWIELSNRIYVDPALPNGTYEYVLRAVDTAGNESADSNTEVLTVEVVGPGPPEDLVVLPVMETTALDLTWNAGPGEPPAVYGVLRALVAGGPYAEVATVTTTGATDDGLDYGVDYFYVVVGRDLAGNESPLSNEAGGTLTLPAPVLHFPGFPGRETLTRESDTSVFGTGLPGVAVELLRDAVLVGPATSELLDSSQPADLGEGSEEARLSPNGDRLWAVGGSDRGVYFYGADEFVSVPGVDQHARWAFDSSALVFVDQATDSVRQWDVATQVTTELVVLDYAAVAVPSSTSGRLIVLGEIDGIEGLYVSEASESVLVSPLPAAEVDINSLTWSPDEGHVAYRQTGPGSQLEVVEIATGATSVPGSQVAGRPSWSPDSRSLAFTSSQSGTNEIWLFDLESGIGTQVTAGGGHSPAWSPDGSRIAYVNDSDAVEVLTLESSAHRELGLCFNCWLQWTASGHLLVAPRYETPQRWTLEGHFSFADVGLEPGPNLFTAFQVAANDAVSGPSAAMPVTLVGIGSSDLALEENELLVLPPVVMAGSAVVLSATISNLGAEPSPASEAVLVVSGPEGFFLQAGLLPLAAIPVGGSLTVSTAAILDGPAGIYTLTAGADPFDVLPELDETNNTAARHFAVVDAPGDSTLSVTTDASTYVAHETLEASVLLLHGGEALDATLTIDVEDALGGHVAQLVETVVALEYGMPVSVPAFWNTGSSFAGAYQVVARLASLSGQELAVGSAAFAIAASWQLEASVATELPSYQVGEIVNIGGQLAYPEGNTLLRGLVVEITLRDPAGAAVDTWLQALGDLLPGAEVAMPQTWDSSAASPGAHSLHLVVQDEGSVLASADTAFLLSEESSTEGTLDLAPNPVGYPESFSAQYSITHHGAAPLTDVPARVRLIHPATSEVLIEQEALHTVPAGGTINGTLDFESSVLGVGDYLSLLALELIDEIGQPYEVALAAAGLQVRDLGSPSVEVVAPQASGYLGVELRVLVLAEDDLSAIDDVEVSVDSGPWAVASPHDPIAGLYRRDLAALTEGPHVVRARAFDVHGNNATTNQVPFVVDTTPPAITVTGVEDGGVYSVMATPVILVAEAHPGEQSIVLNGQDFVSGTPIAAPGSYLLAIDAEDLAGNSSSVVVRFTILPATGGLALVVNTVNDVDDGVCNSSHCSLREAILTANHDPELSMIVFDIPGEDAIAVIDLTAPLPEIHTPVAIDGSSQPGSACTPRHLVIEVQGDLLPTGSDGLTLASDGNLVKGLSLTGFPGDGLVLNGSMNVVSCNHLGVSRDGVAASNAGSGVHVGDGSTANVVGGTGATSGPCQEDCNWIAHNGAHGIAVSSLAGTGTSILGNNIDRNQGLAIDLSDDGLTDNDVGDLDSGPNGLQNFPEVVSVQAGPGSTVRVSLDSTPQTGFEVEIYSNDQANSDSDGAAQDPPFGELRALLGSVTLTTDDQGFAEGELQVVADLTGLFVAATATDLVDGSTSEASRAVFVDSAPSLVAPKTDVLVADNDGNLVPSPGDVLRYEIEISNVGDARATDLQFDDAIPAHTAVVAGSVMTSAGTVASEDPVQVTIEAVEAGSAVAISFEVRIDDPIAAGVDSVVNQGMVASSEVPVLLTDDPDSPGLSDPTETAVTASAILAGATLTVSDLPRGDGDGLAQPGEVLTYVLAVHNTGNAGATSVSVHDLLPPQVALHVESIVVTLGGGASDVTDTSSGNSVDLNIASVPGREGSVTVAFDAELVSAIPAGFETLVDVAQVESFSIPEFDTTSAAIEVDAIPVLTLVKDDGGVNVEPGATVVYQLTIANIGTQDAAEVTMEDTIPTGTAFDQGASDSGWSCLGGDPAGTVCALEFGTLAVSDSVTINFAVEALPPPEVPELIVNGAVVRDDGSGSQGTPVEATDSDTTPVDNLAPPTVTNIDSTLGSGDGVLEECESVVVAVTGFSLTFSEAMNADTVTDTSHWLMLAAGADRDLSTQGCGAVEGDDVAIPILNVTYGAADATAEVELDAEAGLEDGPYRLIACAEDGLEDLSGDELDGNGDSVGGDDFVRTFRIDRLDALANGHFDCSLDAWVPVTQDGSTIEHEEFIDIDNAVISGSARFTNIAGNTELSLGQCVDTQAGAVQEFSGYAQLLTAGSSVELLRACEFFTDDGCFGASLPVQAFFDTIAVVGVWVPFGDEILVPQASSSALCQATVRTTEATPFEALLDDLSLDIVSSPVIFQDGFESGDTSAWSVTVP